MKDTERPKPSVEPSIESSSSVHASELNNIVMIPASLDDDDKNEKNESPPDIDVAGLDAVVGAVNEYYKNHSHVEKFDIELVRKIEATYIEFGQDADMMVRVIRHTRGKYGVKPWAYLWDCLNTACETKRDVKSEVNDYFTRRSGPLEVDPDFDYVPQLEPLFYAEGTDAETIAAFERERLKRERGA